MQEIKTFNFSDPGSLKVDMVTECFQPRFDNTLALMAYQKQTIILTTNGQIVALKRPLRECLKDFCIQNGIYQYEMDAYYVHVNCRTQGLIAGHNRLVPTHGRSNSQVVYYMAHHLGDYCYSKEMNRLLISFEDFHVQIYVDVSLATFQRIIDAADQVSVLQLRNVQSIIKRYGMEKGELRKLRQADDTYCSYQQALRFDRHIRQAMLQNIFRRTFLHSFGEEPDRGVWHCLNQALGQRLRG